MYIFIRLCCLTCDCNPQNVLIYDFVFTTVDPQLLRYSDDNNSSVDAEKMFCVSLDILRKTDGYFAHLYNKHLVPAYDAHVDLHLGNTSEAVQAFRDLLEYVFSKELLEKARIKNEKCWRPGLPNSLNDKYYTVNFVDTSVGNPIGDVEFRDPCRLVSTLLKLSRANLLEYIKASPEQWKKIRNSDTHVAAANMLGFENADDTEVGYHNRLLEFVR